MRKREVCCSVNDFHNILINLSLVSIVVMFEGDNKQAASYEPLLNTQKNFHSIEGSSTHKQRQEVWGTFSPWNTIRTVTKYLFITTISMIAGYFIGHIELSGIIDGYQAPSGQISTVLKYNKTFGRAPSTDVDAAWQSIFPGASEWNRSDHYQLLIVQSGADSSSIPLSHQTSQVSLYSISFTAW